MLIVGTSGLLLLVFFKKKFPVHLDFIFLIIIMTSCYSKKNPQKEICFLFWN